MDDDLGDLDDIMGDDYQHGYDESAGDPNVKPKVTPQLLLRSLSPFAAECCCVARTQ